MGPPTPTPSFPPSPPASYLDRKFPHGLCSDMISPVVLIQLCLPAYDAVMICTVAILDLATAESPGAQVGQLLVNL